MNLHEEEYRQITEAAANNFTLREIAVILLLDPDDFQREYDREHSEVRKRYERGRLESENTITQSLRDNAEGGNITAVQIFDNKRKEKDFQAAKDRILFLK